MEIYKTLSKLLIKNKKSYIYLNIYVFVPPCSGRGVSCSGLLLRFLSGVSLGGGSTSPSSVCSFDGWPFKIDDWM